MTAYTTTSLLSKSSVRMMSLSDVNHCTCSSSANYDVVDSQFEDVDDDTETMSTTYVCNPVNKTLFFSSFFLKSFQCHWESILFLLMKRRRVKRMNNVNLNAWRVTMVMVVVATACSSAL